MTEDRSWLQLVWGILLAAAGVGVFIRVPQVMPKLETLETFSGASGFVRFCFYFMGVLLIGGGVKKIYRHLNLNKAPETDRS